MKSNRTGVGGNGPPRPLPRPPPLLEEVEKGIRVCLEMERLDGGFVSFLPIPMAVPPLIFTV